MIDYREAIRACKDEKTGGVADLISAAILVFLVAVAGVTGVVYGYAFGEKATRAEAIEAGVAEWAIDPKTGEKSFRWIVPTERSE